jgi:protein SCO1/2
MWARAKGTNVQRRAFSAGGASVAAGAAAAATLSLSTANAHPGHTQIPNTEVIDENGKAYRFYDDLVKDRVVMINFFFQSCGGTCPLTTQNLR